jgi:hypothetical protein
MRHAKLALACLGAACVLTFAVGSASANRLSGTTRNFRAVFNPLSATAEGVGTVRCPVTLEGSFHSSTIGKVAHALMGHISRASLATASCTGGSATISAESLPWPISYESFQGTLPNITGVFILVLGLKIIIVIGGIRCELSSESRNPGRGIASLSAGRVTEVRADETTRIPLVGEGGLCALARGSFSGNGTASVLGTTTAISVRLI